MDEKKEEEFVIKPPWVPDEMPEQVEVPEEDKEKLFALIKELGGEVTFQDLTKEASERFEWEEGYVFVVSTHLNDEGRITITKIKNKKGRGPSFTGVKVVEE